MQDLSIRFSFDKLAIRGAYVSLHQSVNTAQAVSSYPEGVALLLAQFMAANAVISALTQFEGTMTLQARSDKQLGLIMSEHHHNGNMRAIARNHAEATSHDFRQLLGDGILTLTLDPETGKRYQGIISLSDDDLAASLSHYFKQSEQLNTHIVIRHTNSGIVALMLQAMPNTAHSKLGDDDWLAATSIADTLTSEEAEALTHNDILFRLFHKFDVRVQAPSALQYHCHCSKSRISKALKTLSEAELRGYIEQDGQIEVNCDFCDQAYLFSAYDLDQIFGASPSRPNHTDAKLH